MIGRNSRRPYNTVGPATPSYHRAMAATFDGTSPAEPRDRRRGKGPGDSLASQV